MARLRDGLGLLFLIGAFFAFDPVEDALHRPLAAAAGLHMIADGEMTLFGYGALMVVRLALELMVVAGVLAILGRRWRAFPLVGPRMGRLTCLGVATGLLVMIGAILAIILGGSATVAASTQGMAAAALHGTGWLVFDMIGAAGEELYGRVAVLLVAERLIGWRGAIVASGLLFSAVHLGSPGADWMWLVRLFLQGMLLAFAVYRTRSVWWSIGYHSGWNWASAPLFGAAGSGYLDQGHLFDFKPTGSGWITGGAVGPEGSVYAFAAVACAFAILVATTAAARPARQADA